MTNKSIGGSSTHTVSFVNGLRPFFTILATHPAPIIQGVRQIEMDRDPIVIRAISLLLCVPFSCAYAEHFDCVIESHTSKATSESSNFMVGASFSVDNFTGEIQGDVLIYEKLQYPVVSNNPANGSFRVSFFTARTQRTNFLIVFPESNSAQLFTFHIAGSRFVGHCVKEPNNQINEDAPERAYF